MPTARNLIRGAVGSFPFYVIAAIAHWAIYLAVLFHWCPYIENEAMATGAAILMLVASGLAAATWPVVDAYIMQTVAVTAAWACIIVTALAAVVAWLGANLLRKAVELHESFR